MGEDSLGVQVLEEGPGLTNWPRALPGRQDPLGFDVGQGVCRLSRSAPNDTTRRRQAGMARSY